MQKNSITNKITPCCGLPFSVMYWFIQNITLSSETDRSFIFSKLRTDGSLPVTAWTVLINSGTLEADAGLNKEQFLEIFNCRKKPTCAELKLIIEGFKVGNWKPEIELNYYNSQTGGIQDVADTVIKRISKHSKQELTYIETTLNESGVSISDADVTGDGFFIKEGSKYYKQIFSSVIDIRNLGILPDGTDMTDKLNAVLQRFKDRGASFAFSEHEYRFDGKIVIPYIINNGSDVIAIQPPFTFIGSGSGYRTKAAAPIKKGSVLKLNYKGSGNLNDAKIVSYGCGKITFKGLTFETSINHETPFFYSNYTTVDISQNLFLNSSGQNNGNCLTHCLVFGGSTDAETGFSIDNGFQGYGSVISGNAFSSIAVAVYGRIYFNGVVIKDNWIDHLCGHSNLAPFVVDSTKSTQYAVGNMFTGNTIELGAYKHAAILRKCLQASWISNGVYDEDSTFAISVLNLENSSWCYIQPSFASIPLTINNNDSHTIIDPRNFSYFTELRADRMYKVSKNQASESVHQVDMDGNTFLTRMTDGSTVQFIKMLPDETEIIMMKLFRSETDGNEILQIYGQDSYFKFEGNGRIFVPENKEVWIGDETKPMLIYKGGMRFTPIDPAISVVLPGSMFVDSADGKLKFKDSLGTINPLY